MIVLMEQLFIYLALIIIGLCMGSFAGASVWRLRAHQLVEEKASGEKIDMDEYERLKKLTKVSLVNDRSKCLNCSYLLKWYDMVPLISWISLGGKCRKCRKPIGHMEPLIELGVAAFFVLSYAFWPYLLSNNFEIARFIVWIISGVGLAILFAYDAKWFLLPDKINYALIVVGILNALLVVLNASDIASALLGILGSVLILSGLYLILYLISRGSWVGFGDVKLCLGLALLLADWKLAFIALFAANLVGCFMVLPGLLTGKLKRDSHVPFGPLLIIGTVIAALVGDYLINIFLFGLV